MLDGALREHDRLVRLLDGLQALARGDAAPLDAGPVDLAELVDGAAEAVTARHPGLALETEAPAGPVAVTGWEPGLRILVENLIENAARHGRPGGHVRVGLAAAWDGAGPRLVVDDDGPGVAAADRARIFEPFARLDGAGGVGSGLGLALVAQQARHHGADVEVGDSPLGGARFAVAFPA
jgi:two-component system, OmpR family, sensor histidine kinase PrrB